jgi:hypothetical protein
VKNASDGLDFKVVPCENPAAPRKCQMALRFFLVTQTSFEEGATQTYGDFVIDTPFSTQGEILESLTDDDAKQIGLRLGIISDPEGEMPLEVRYTLGPFEELLRICRRLRPS